MKPLRASLGKWKWLEVPCVISQATHAVISQQLSHLLSALQLIVNQAMLNAWHGNDINDTVSMPMKPAQNGAVI
jgi:hypothetical protein